MGHDVRKTVFGGLRTKKAQTSLRIRSDLEITQLHHQGRRQRSGHDHFIVQKRF